MSYEDQGGRNEKDNNVEIWKIKKLIKVSRKALSIHQLTNYFFRAWN